MMLISRTLVCVALAALPAAGTPGLPARPAPRVASAQEDTSAEFLQKFRAAMQLGDADQMAQIVKRYQNDAVAHVERTCTQISEQTSEELEREIAALSKAWRSSMKGEFVNRYYEYLSLISPPERRERQRIAYEFNTAVRKYFENLNGSKDGPTFEVLADQFKAFAEAFKTIGDQYNSAQAWINYGACYEENVRSRKERAPKKVVEGFLRAVEAMDKIDLKYARYHQIKDRYETLANEGWLEALDNPDAPEPGQPKVKGDPVNVPLSFEGLKDIDDFDRVSYFADELYQMWPALYFANSKGAEATFPGVTGSPRVVRNEAASLEIHTNGDDQADGEIKITGKLTPTQTEILEGGQRGWAFVTATGIEGDTYQGLQLNLAPAEYMSVYYINAASVVGTFGELPLRILDDNCDGIYGSYPGHWEYLGLGEGRTHPTLDSIVIGKGSKRALPWSQYQKLGEQWYTLATEEGGTRLVATPVDLETGTLKLEFKGPAPTWVVMQGLDNLEWSYFDLLQNGRGKPVEVPAGSYMLKVGELRKGKQAQTMKALILAGEDTPVWDVQPGKETVVELGGPFGFEFKHVSSDEGVTVLGQSVTIIGVANERYERTWNCVPYPTMSVRAVGEKRGSKPEDMGQVLDMLEMEDGRQKYDYADVWYPLDTTVEAKGEAFEVQLIEKKNKLFGKIESDWR